jgi:SAM-dependent methyltransferase
VRGWQIGESLPDGRLLAAAADRNQAPILEVLQRELPPSGLVLEIASGTGQHVAHFAKSLPQLSWQPSDPDPEFRRSISLWTALENLANVNVPIMLDVRQQPWPIAAADAIVCINMVHIAPWAAAQALFEGARQVLPHEGLLYLYGPFRRGGDHTSPSNARFDADLRARDPEWGLRDVEALAAVGSDTGFALADTVAMPANNLSLVFRKRNAAAE